MPGGRKYKATLVRALCLSKATYGWVCKAPTQKDIKELQQAAKKVTKVSRATNPDLRNMMEGATGTTGDLSIVILQRQISMFLKRLKNRENLEEEDPCRQIIYKTLWKLGWENKGKKWNHTTAGTFKMDTGDDIEKIKHMIRESYHTNAGPGSAKGNKE